MVKNEREMLLEKGRNAILPCAGITLIRFTGLISASLVFYKPSTPGTLKTIKAFI